MILENLGICFGIFVSIILFPWIFTIFIQKKEEFKDDLELEEMPDKEIRTYSYHIDLSTQLIINFEELDDEFKRELEKRKISLYGSKSTLLRKIKDVDEMIKITNIRELYSSADYFKTIEATMKRLEIYPDEIEPKIFLFRSYFLTKQYDECIEICNDVLKIEPLNINALRFIARSNTQLGKQDDALINYLDVIKKYPEDLDSLSNIMRIYYNFENFEECIIFSKKVLKIEETNISAMRFIARSYKNMLNLELSENQYLQIIKLEPNDLDSLIMLTRIYYTQENYKKCIDKANKILEIDDNNLEIMRYIARSYGKLDDELNMKEKYLAIIQKFPEDVNTLLILSRIYYNNENFEECIHFSEEILNLEKNNIDAMRFIARSNHKLGNQEKSLSNYLNIFSEYPEDSDTISTLMRIYYRVSDFDNVLIYCEKLLEIDENNETANIFKARINMKLGEYEIAYTVWQKLLQIDQNNLEALIGSGRGLYLLGDYSKSREFLERVLEISPDERRARRTLALVYERAKEYEKALQLHSIECEQFPETFSNWEKKVNILFRMNKKEQAYHCLDEIYSALGDTLEGNLMAYTLSTSYYWTDKATQIIQSAEERWGDDTTFHTSITKNSLDEGNLTRAYIHLSKSKEIEINEVNSNLERRLMEMLNSTSTTIENLENLISRGEDLLFIECIFRAISERAKKIKRRTSTNKKLNVSIVSSSLGRGGAERQVVACLDGLSKNKKINEVKLYCFGADNTGGAQETYIPEIKEIGVEMVEFGKLRDWNKGFDDEKESLIPWRDLLDLFPKRFLREIEPLYLHFKKEKPDIVHTWQDQTNINAGIAALMAGVPGIVMFARSQRPDGKTMMHIRNRPYLKKAYKSIFEHPNVLLCHNSNSGAKSYSEWFDDEELEFPVIYNGTDFEGIKQASLNGSIEKTWNKLSIPNNALIVGSVFRFVNEKQPYLWIDTLIKVCKENPRVYGIVVGSGGLMDSSEKYLKEKGMDDRIFFPGQTRMVKSWLDKFDLFFLCSRVEGLPNVIIEAQGFGVPVISTNAGGAYETIIDGETGHIVESHDPNDLSERIISVLEDEVWLETARKRSIEFAQRTFSTSNMIKRLLEIYQTSLKN
tara:strand:- start:3654 stop:6989 length:3336 start_codon:yes stop_codon:yes gene_type:complete